MITKAIKSKFPHSRIFPTSYLYDEQQVLISNRQRKILTELIYQNIDDDLREGYISQLEEMTYEDANLMILDFQCAKWR